MNGNRSLCDRFVRTVGRFFNKDSGPNSSNLAGENLSMMAVESFEMEEVLEMQKVTYPDVRNIEQATAMIESCEELKDTEKVLLLTVQLDDTFAFIDAQKLAQKSSKKSIVLFLESKTGKKFSILWKSKDAESFYAFGHYSMGFDEADRKVYKFIADFLAKSLSRRHLGFKSLFKDEKILLTDMYNYRGFSLLLIAIEQGNTEMAKTLLNLGVSTVSLDGAYTAQSLAWDLRNSELLLQMAKSNMKYPAGLDPSELSEEFQTFYKETEELHATITARNKEQVDEILKSSQHKLRFYFNLANESAASVAIKQGSTDIYEILLRHDVFLAEDGLLSKLSGYYRQTVKDLHTKYRKESEDKHINILYSCSHAAHDAMDAKGNMKHVRKAYELLTQNHLLNVILRVVAAIRKFDIYYDFNRDATNVVDPTTSDGMKGVFYPRGQIFIGAKQLLDENNKFQTISTIAHELCHFACNIMYKNDAKPFAKNDEKTREWFEEINEKCKANMNEDEVVRRVYECYGSDDILAELIVRAPHMLALYFDQPEKQRECRSSFPELFDFYETHLVPKMEEAIPEIEAKAEREIEKKEMKIIKYKFFLVLSILLAIVGIIVTTFIVKGIFFKPVYSYSTLDIEKQQKVRDGPVFYKGVELRLHDLFENDSLAYQNLTSDHITQIIDENIPLDFSSPHLGYLDRQVEHNWQNMSEKLREKVLKSNFTFQNESLALAELTKTAPKAFNSLTSGQIDKILDGTFAIGAMIANETQFYVERYVTSTREFKPEDVNATASDWNFPSSFSTFSSLILIMNSTELIEKTQMSRFFILSDEAGTGKSMTFQQMTMEVKKKFPGHWVSYFDFKDYTRFYDAKKISTDPLGVLEDILDLKSKSQFELKIFEELFEAGKVVFFWDGFDEISPTFSDQVIGLMKFVYEKSKNVQYICTRPVYANLLEKAFKIHPMKLKPYTRSEQEELLRKYFISEKVDESDIVNLTEKIMEISTELKYETPLMLMLIAEVHEDLKVVESPKIYKIYEIFVEKKIRIWRSKSESNKEKADKLLAKGFNVNKIHQKYAILREIESLNIPRMKIMKTRIPKGLNYDEFSRMGILYINTETIFDFSHKTFGEFFVAQFLVQNFLELEEDKTFDENVIDILYDPNMSQMIRSFLLDYVEEQKFNGTEHFHHEVEKFLRQKHKNYFFNILLDEYLRQNFKMFSFMLSKNHTLLLDMLHVNEDETLYTASYNQTSSLFLTHHIPNLREIENTTVKLLTKDEFSRFVTGRNQKGVILYGIVLSNLEGRPIRHPKYSLSEQPGDAVASTELRAYGDFRVEFYTRHRDRLINVDVTEEYVQNFYENIKGNLTEAERKNLLRAILSYPIYYYHVYRRLSIPLDRYEKLWEEGEKLLGREERKSIIAGVLGSREFDEFQMLDFILDKANTTLSDDEIFESFKNKQYCLKYFLTNLFYSDTYFDKLWDFLSSHTTKEQQKIIMLQEFEIDGSEPLNNGLKLLFHQKNRITLFNFLLLEKYSIKLGYPLSNWISENATQEIISSSNDFMMSSIAFELDAPEMISGFLESLEKLFAGHEKDLIEFLKGKVSGTDYTLASYFDIIPNVSSYKENIKNFTERIEEIIGRLEVETSKSKAIYVDP